MHKYLYTCLNFLDKISGSKDIKTKTFWVNFMAITYPI